VKERSGGGKKPERGRSAIGFDETTWVFGTTVKKSYEKGPYLMGGERGTKTRRLNDRLPWRIGGRIPKNRFAADSWRTTKSGRKGERNKSFRERSENDLRATFVKGG